MVEGACEGTESGNHGGHVMDQETNQRSVLNTLMSPAASMTADATIAIIAEEGFDRVSVRRLAARLDVAPGTVE